MDEFYNRMKETRIKAEKSQKETADFLKISQQQYSLYENGKRYIPIDLLKKFCEYLNCSADYILGLERGTREHTDNCTKYIFLYVKEPRRKAGRISYSWVGFYKRRYFFAFADKAKKAPLKKSLPPVLILKCPA